MYSAVARPVRSCALQSILLKRHRLDLCCSITHAFISAPASVYITKFKPTSESQHVVEQPPLAVLYTMINQTFPGINMYLIYNHLHAGDGDTLLLPKQMVAMEQGRAIDSYFERNRTTLLLRFVLSMKEHAASELFSWSMFRAVGFCGVISIAELWVCLHSPHPLFDCFNERA